MIKQGTLRDDGRLFWGMTRGYEQWVTPSAFHNCKLSSILAAVRDRVRKQHIPFDLDRDYLASIFPKDAICPILGIKMEWGTANGGLNTSPSLDRIVPDRGYVKGNVAWISMRANRLKNDASLGELEKIVAYMNAHRGVDGYQQ